MDKKVKVSWMMAKENIFYGLTEPQNRIWYTQMIYPESSMFNIGGTVEILGAIEVEVLKQAICAFINAHDAFQIRLLIQEEKPVQYFNKDYVLESSIDFIDFSSNDEPKQCFKNWVKSASKELFEMIDNPLYNFVVFKINDTKYGYYVKTHHIICDGWSMQIFSEEICENYTKLINGDYVNKQSEYLYKDYIFAEKEYLQSSRYKKNKKFWHDLYTPLPEEKLYSAASLEGNRKTFYLSEEEKNLLEQYCDNYKISVNAFFLCLYLIVINKTTGREDIVIGNPVLGRLSRKERNVIGMFVGSMPFRYFMTENETIVEMMSKVFLGLKRCIMNQQYPLNYLIKDLNLGSTPLYTACVNYYNTNMYKSFSGLPVDYTEFYNGEQEYSIQLIIRNWSDIHGIQIDVDYKTSEFTEQQIHDMISQMKIIMAQTFENPSKKVSEICLLTDKDIKKFLIDYNNTVCDYPKKKTVIDLFKEQKALTPNRVAVEYRDDKLTFYQLDILSDYVADLLHKEGIKNGAVVGLVTVNSLETVIAILGIMKAGGAYLPIDSKCPIDRMNYMLKDAGVEIVLSNCNLPENLSLSGRVIRLDDVINTDNIKESLEVSVNLKPNDLAYIIYTSGTTGNPKGVMIEHQGLVNYIWWAKKMYVRDENEVFPLYSSIAFDLTVTSIFTPLLSGNKILIYNDSDDDYEYVLERIVREKKATIIKLTPSHLSLLIDSDNKNSSVKRFIVGGEDLKVNLAKSVQKSFGDNVEIFNEYGPTETVVGCMIHKYDYAKDTCISVPIGIPADNVQIYILDKNLNPVPTNAVGEMYISGDGVARGYLNMPKLTQEKFVNNPFISGKRMYRTGDLARFLYNGEMEYFGRIDNQIKIRGYRIELREIEKYLLTHEAIKDAVVVDYEGDNKVKYLCAYYVEKADVQAIDLKSFLMKHFPDYMVPLYYIVLDEIPLTINGKINKTLLPKPDITVAQNYQLLTYRNEKEKMLVNIICEVLKVNNISITHNFYYLGGDSIKAIQIASKMNEKGLMIKVKDILSHPIIEEMAVYVEYSSVVKINQENQEGIIKPTPIVRWFFSQNFANPNYYNQSVLIEFKKDIEIKKLNIAFNELIKHHDALRINYDFHSKELYYNKRHLNHYHDVFEYNLADLPSSMQLEKILHKCEKIKASFSLDEDILIKACMFDLGCNGKRLLITAHHLIIDGVSWRIILEDLYNLLRQLSEDAYLKLPAKTHSVQLWAEEMEKYSKTIGMRELNYWNEVLNYKFSYPHDYDMGEDTIEHSDSITIQLSKELTTCLLTKANYAYNTEPRDLMIIALLNVIKKNTNLTDIVIELEGHGREELCDNIDISRTVGWFTTIYPVLLRIHSDDFTSQIKSIKEQIRQIPKNGLDYGVLKYMTNTLDDNTTSNIRFNYLGDFASDIDNEFFSLQYGTTGNECCTENKLTTLIDINCYIRDNELTTIISYSKNKFSQNTIKRFAYSYEETLNNIINHCYHKNEIEFTPSDFSAIGLSQDDIDTIFN